MCPTPSLGHWTLAGEHKTQSKPRTVTKAQMAFFKQFDVDGDGLMSFSEFLLVLTLLSIHEHDVQIIFDVVDLDNNGVIDKDEFKQVVDLLQSLAHVHTSKVTRSHKVSA